MGSCRKCAKCQGRLFLERDYDDNTYHFFCIACGHTEPYPFGESNPKTSTLDTSNPNIREAAIV
jgi:hypothetical protein